MKALLKQDYYMIATQCKSALLIFFVFSLVGIFSRYFSYYAVLFFSMTIHTVISYEERAKTDRFTLTMPVSRKAIVTNKYVLGLLFLGVGAICNLLILELDALVRTGQWNTEGIVLMLYTVCGGALYQSLTLPASLRFGSEKGRMAIWVMNVIFFAGFAIVFGILLNEFYLDTFLQFFFQPWLLACAAGITVICYILSYLLSLRCYETREF